MLSSRLLRLALGAGTVLAAAGCLSNNDPTGTTQTAAAGIRVVQLVSDAPGGLDFAINGSLQATAIPFGTLLPNPSTQIPYAPEPAGPQLAFAIAGSTSAFYNQIASSITPASYATVVVFGRVTPGAAPGATVAVLSDTTANAATAVLVRILNTIDYVTAGAGTPVDVYVYAQGSPRPTTPTVSALAWGARSPYISVAPGNLQVDVTAAGSPSTTAALFTTTLTAGATTVRTLILRDPPAGSVAGTSGAVLTLNDQG